MKAIMKRLLMLFTSVVPLASCAVVQSEPEQSEVVRLMIYPAHLQTYAQAPQTITISVEGDINDTVPLSEVLMVAELRKTGSHEAIRLDAVEISQDETYRGAEVQLFHFPPVDDGDYEIAVQLKNWGRPLVGGNVLQEGELWRSRFRIDRNYFHLNGLSVCERRRLLLQFSEPLLSFSGSDLATRLLVVAADKEIPCVPVHLDGELVGGSTIELQCEADIAPPFRLLFSELQSAEAMKALSTWNAPETPLQRLDVETEPEFHDEACLGWAVP